MTRYGPRTIDLDASPDTWMEFLAQIERETRPEAWRAPEPEPRLAHVAFDGAAATRASTVECPPAHRRRRDAGLRGLVRSLFG